VEGDGDDAEGDDDDDDDGGDNAAMMLMIMRSDAIFTIVGLTIERRGAA
jgi:hypothetical protein